MNATSNGIQARQHETANVAKLTAADRLYREIKRLKLLQLLLAVILPLLCTCLQLFNQGGNSLLDILAILSFVLSLPCKSTIDGKNTLAADIKQDFDVSVYQMPWNEDLFGERRDLTKEIAENSGGVENSPYLRDEDWYNKKADAMPILDGIFACQRENYAWDSAMRKRYRNLCALGIGALILAVVAVEIYKNETAAALVSGIVFILSALNWLLNIVHSLNEDLKRLDKMKASFQSTDTRTMKDLQKIQKAIYEHRKRAVVPPQFIYKMFKDSDEKTAKHMMKMGSGGDEK
ncbi:MAG: hypothetical protein IJT31_09130 [Oscillibacter sp.]|nr:hypothetical protein [Oscillibacter sp.]